MSARACAGRAFGAEREVQRRAASVRAYAGRAIGVELESARVNAGRALAAEREAYVGAGPRRRGRAPAARSEQSAWRAPTLTATHETGPLARTAGHDVTAVAT